MTARRKHRPVAPAPDPLRWTDALETARSFRRFVDGPRAERPITVAEFADTFQGIDISLDDGLRLWRKRRARNTRRDFWVCMAVRELRLRHRGANSCAVVAAAFGMSEDAVEKVWRHPPGLFRRSPP